MNESKEKLEPIAVRASEAAKMLGVSRPKIYELAARDDFHGVFKFGGCTLFSVEAMREWVRMQCGQNDAALSVASTESGRVEQNLNGTVSTSSIHGNRGFVK